MLEIRNNMKNCIIYIVILFIFSCCSDDKKEVSVSTKVTNLQLNADKHVYVAGEKIILFGERTFKQLDDKPNLIVENSFGSIIVEALFKDDKIEFEIPFDVSKRIGICKWKLVLNEKIVDRGEIIIKPSIVENNQLESYFGPRSISAGDRDFSMLVTVPIDGHDNPVEENTNVLIKHQFENNIQNETIKTKDLIAWKNIYATKKAGRILVTAFSNSVNSKELTTMVFPSNATNFTISYKRDHDFADGNQVINLVTSVITDEFNNVISDGTLVNFNIKNKKGTKLSAVGLSIGGKATAKMLHPDQEEIWGVQAFVIGAAKSNQLSISFRAAIKDYEVIFSEGNRKIKIGPFKSFMDQLAPDGLLTRLTIYDANHRLVDSKVTTLKDGNTNFYLDEDYYKHAMYELEIQAAGIIKTFNKQLDVKKN